MILSALSGGVVIWILTLIYNGGGFIATTNENVKETKIGLNEHVKDDFQFQSKVLVKITGVESDVKNLNNSLGDLKKEVKNYMDYQQERQKKEPEF